MVGFLTDIAYQLVDVAVGVTLGALLILVARSVLPERERDSLRLPTFLLTLYVVMRLVREVLEGRPLAGLAHALGVLALLTAIARTVVLISVSVLDQRAARPVPRIIVDVVQSGIFFAISLFALQQAGLDPGSLLTTSALLTAVIGLSLQDTLGNLFSGLAIQAQNPFETGDWIRFGDSEDDVGRVLEMNWRAVTVVTLDRIEITVPNAMLAKSPIANFTKNNKTTRRKLEVAAPYEVPPRRVQRAIEAALRDVPGVAKDPPPKVFTYNFADSGITYRVRYFLKDFASREVIDARVRDRIWYALNRANIQIPFPIRTVYMHEAGEDEAERDAERRLSQRERALRDVDFLRVLPSAELHRLATACTTRIFAPGETIIRQGDHGDDLFLIEAGEVRVIVDEGNPGGGAEVARLTVGDVFGEMSLMTGEERKATVRARTETEVIVVSKAVFQPILEATPELAEHISAELARREQQLDEHAPHEGPSKVAEAERRDDLLHKIRRFFSL